jgi:NADPH2:quinone reductase
MRAVLCTELSDIPVVSMAEHAPPAMASGQIRIHVHAAGLNFADLLLLQGKYQEKPDLPFTPGMELAGVVAELGTDVTGFAVGDRVLGIPGLGAYADEAVLDAGSVYHIPDNLGLEAAAGFPIVYGTAHLGLTHKARLQSGETLLVHGAAGGVGLAAVEIGTLIGARVIATASTEDKLAVARCHGASHALLSATPDLAKRLKAVAGPGGIDVAFDPVGGPMFEASLRAIAWEGRLLVIGFAAGIVQQIPANVVLVKNCDVLGFFWGAYRTRDPETVRRSLEEALSWVGEGRLQPDVPETFPLERAADALHRLRSRQSIGKVVLTTGR